MNREEKLLCDLIDYFKHLDASDKFYCCNRFYFRKLGKLLKAFVKEYTKNHWGWY